MNHLLETTFYGNPLYDWLIAVIYIFGSYTAAKILYLFTSKIAKKFTSRTKTKIDDIIIDMVEEPLTFGIIIAGFWLGISQLILSENVALYSHKIFYVLITFDISWLSVRLIDALLIEYLQPLVEKSESTLDDQLFPIVRKVIKFTLWSIAVIVGLNNAGYDVGALIAGLGLGGLAFAMAAKDSIANLFGGFTVFLDKPFKVTDRIQIDKFDGTVIEIGIRSTRLKTLEGRIVTIPNARFASEAIINVSLEPALKVVQNLLLTYNTPVEKISEARGIIKKLCSENPNIEDDVTVSFNEFNQTNINLVWIYYIKKGADIFNTKNEINIAVLSKLNETGLNFAYVVHNVYTNPDLSEKNQN
jgi:MscS family membrane protein